MVLLAGVLLLFFSFKGWATPWIISLIVTLSGVGILLYAYFILKPRALENEVEEE